MFSTLDPPQNRMFPEMMMPKNVSNISHWSLENGYTDGARQRDYPIRVFHAQRNAALHFFLQIYKQDLEYICRGFIKGFKLFLHTPGEVLGESWPYFRIPLLDQIEVSIKPTLITTSNGLRQYRPNQRQCYFESERRLRFFKIYSQNNCETECLANYTERMCGCVKFSMPSTISFHFIINYELLLYFGRISRVFRTSNDPNLWYIKIEMLQRCRKEIIWRRRYGR